MADNKTSHTDEGLQDNEQIEQAILALQQQPSQEMPPRRRKAAVRRW